MSKIQYTEDFEAFWKAYPRTPIMSKIEAFKVWSGVKKAGDGGKFTDEDRVDAMIGLLAYKEWLKARPGHPACHAETFLRQRRFEGFAEAATQAALAPATQEPKTPLHGAPWGTGTWVQEGSLEWKAWSRYYQTILRQVSPPLDRFGGWTFGALWPPTVVQPVQSDLSDEYGEYGSLRPVG